MNRWKLYNEIRNTRTLKRWVIEGLNLSGLDFSDVDCEGSKFIRCNLQGADFSRSNLCEAAFQRCRLSETKFESANIKGTKFISCKKLSTDQIVFLTDKGAVFEKTQGLEPAPITGVVLLALALLLAAYFALPSSKPTTGDIPANLKPIPDDACGEMTPEACLAKGKEALEAKAYDKAESLLNSLRSRGHENVEVIFYLARLYIETNQLKKAKPFVEQVITMKPEPLYDLPSRQYLAQIYYQTGLHDKADEELLSLYTKYEADHAISRDIVYLQATLYWQGGEYEKALATCQRLLKLSDKEQIPEVELMIGLIFRDSGRPLQAKEKFQSLIRNTLTPTDVANNARINLANAALSEGDIIAAERLFRDAVESSADPGQCNELATRISTSLTAAGKQEHAKELLTYVIGKFPNEIKLNSSRIALASIKLTEGKKEEARQLFDWVCRKPSNQDQGRWACEMSEEIAKQINAGKITTKP